MNNDFRSLKKLKYIFIGIAVVIALLGLFLLFPKNVSRLWIFAIVFIADFYLWSSFKKLFKTQRGFLYSAFKVFYWTPEFAVCLVLLLSLLPVNFDAQNTFSTLTLGLTLMIFISKFSAVIVLFIEFLIRFFQWLFFAISDKSIKTIYRPRRVLLMMKLSFIGFFATIILFVFGIFSTRTYNVEKIDIEFENLPKSFQNLKIVHISDLHLVSWTSAELLGKSVKAINNLEPDLILITGDLVSFKASEILPFVDVLSDLKAQYGIYNVLGNHDYGDYVKWNNRQEMVQNMKDFESLNLQMGWNLLKDENVKVFSPDSSEYISIIGVENWSKSTHFNHQGDIDVALQGVGNEDFKILLSHDPSHWEFLMENNYDIDLTLSGHTHAMQFGANFSFFKWSPVKYISKHWHGLYLHSQNTKENYLHVSAGMGCVGFVSRVGFPPEISLIELQRK